MTQKNKTNADAFGLTEEETEKLVDILPTLDLGKLAVGESVKVKILQDAPKQLTYTDKKTQKEVTTPVLEVLDKSTGLKSTLWLSAKSLKQAFYQLHKKLGTLENVDAVIGKRQYQHPQFGETDGYTVQKDAETN